MKKCLIIFLLMLCVIVAQNSITVYAQVGPGDDPAIEETGPDLNVTEIEPEGQLGNQAANKSDKDLSSLDNDSKSHILLYVGIGVGVVAVAVGVVFIVKATKRKKDFYYF